MIKIKHIYAAIILLLITANTAFAQSSATKTFQPFLTRGETTWSVSAGIRRNDFDWNIASDITGTATPNILSELTWEDVTVLELKGKVRHVVPVETPIIDGGFHMEAGITGGITVGGDNQDSDFNGDNRTLEFSRSNNSASTGSTIGLSTAVGYKIQVSGSSQKARAILTSRRPKTARGRAKRARALREALNDPAPTISLTPLIGFGWDQHTYNVTGGNQTIPATGPFGGVDSKYIAEWYGPFIGLETEFAGKKNMLRLRGEYHDLTYYGEAVWNLRAGFRQDPSFVHEADGDGILLNAEYAYALGKDYALTVDAMYQKRTAEDGTDQTFLTTGASPTIRLNEVNDESQSLHVGLRYNW